MPSIFDFTDYRKYLEACYQEFKQARPGFSYRTFAAMAGFKDKSSLYGPISGHRNLTKPSIIKLSRALKHKRAEAEYFDALVGFNQAKKMDERNHYYERLNNVRGKGTSRARVLREDQFEYFSNWYHSAVRALIEMTEFKSDFKWLARMVNPAITPRRAKESVLLLERLGLIKRQKNGAYVITDKSITSGNDVSSLALQMFHIETAQLAQRAVAELPRNRRNISGLTLGISEKTYHEICDRTNAFHDEIMALADKDENADRVYQFNFHLFPISKL